MILRSFLTICCLLGASAAHGDEPRAPEPSVVVRLRFDGKPIRVIVDTEGHTIKDVRWAVGNLFKSYDGVYEPESVNEVTMKARNRELYDKIHKESPSWESWSHKVDRREQVDLVFHGIKPIEGFVAPDAIMQMEHDSWAGVTITARPYGGKVLAELRPYYTEFKEAPKPRQRRINRNRGRQLQERQTQEIADLASSVFGPLRSGEMVLVPADLKVLETQASQKFDSREETTAADDSTAAKRQWASLLLVDLQLASARHGVPMRFYVGDELLPAHVEDNEQATDQKYQAAVSALKKEQDELKKLTIAYEAAHREAQAKVCKEILGFTPEEVEFKLNIFHADAKQLKAIEADVIAKNEDESKTTYLAKVAKLKAEFMKLEKQSEQVTELLDRIAVAGSKEQQRVVELVVGRTACTKGTIGG